MILHWPKSELAGRYVFCGSRELPIDAKNGDIRLRIIDLIQNGNLPVHMENDRAVLVGKDLIANIKSDTLYGLFLLSEHCSELQIRNLAIGVNDAEIIQAMIKSHLASVVVESCSFKFSFEPDSKLYFSALKTLTRIQCSNCIVNDLMSMLETIQSGNLIHLNITDCSMSFDRGERLMTFLLQHRNL